MRQAVRRSAVTIAAVAAIGAATAAPVVAAEQGAGAVRLGGTATRSGTPNSAPCFHGGSVCQSTNPDVSLSFISNGDTSACTFNGSFGWGDGSTTNFSFHGGPNGSTDVTKKHHYSKLGTYNGTWSSTVTSGNCHSSSGTFQFTLLGCGKQQLSGPSWGHAYADSRSLSTLAKPFRTKVEHFLSAAEKAGIKVSIHATRRPRQLAYLNHWSWLIAHGQADPGHIPAFVPAKGETPVDICWAHTDAHGKVDKAASVNAAKQMVKALHIDPRLNKPPAADSRHTEGLAIDVVFSWTKHTITIRDAAGHSVKISTTPHSDLNKQLIQVGATYGVIHFKFGKDPNHWSTDGH